MIKFYELFKSLGFDLVAAVAGLSGAWVFLRTSPKELSRGAKFATYITGFLTANYLTPLVIGLLGYIPIFNDGGLSDISGGFSFIIGFLGLKSLEIILNNLESISSKWGLIISGLKHMATKKTKAESHEGQEDEHEGDKEVIDPKDQDYPDGPSG